MGLNYLGGHKWSEITREERFFCCELYKILTSSKDCFREFLLYVKEQLHTNIDVDPDKWELGYEVAFGRDYFYNCSKKNGNSSHRKFDLCLFSDSVTIVIEAKAFEGFESEQVNKLFKDDVKELKENTNTDVYVLGLISSKYKSCKKFSNDVTKLFTNNGADFLLWCELSRRLCNSEILKRADEVYEPYSERNKPLVSCFRGNDE